MPHLAQIVSAVAKRDATHERMMNALWGAEQALLDKQKKMHIKDQRQSDIYITKIKEQRNWLPLREIKNDFELKFFVPRPLWFHMQKGGIRTMVQLCNAPLATLEQICTLANHSEVFSFLAVIHTLWNKQ